MFGLPSVWLVGSVLLWVVMRRVDEVLDPDTTPGVLATTVDSARALLGAVASGTIAAASVVFSLTLVAIQLSSNSYSSRVLRTFLRDRFQQNMMGVVLATFFYSLLVLRDVRGPLAKGGDANLPSASVSLAVVLALAAILALLASISHTAQSVRVSHVSSSVRNDTRSVIIDRFGPPRAPVGPRVPRGRSPGSTGGPEDGEQTLAPFDVQAPGVTPSPLVVAVGDRTSAPEPPADRARYVVDAAEGGWVQQLSVDAVIDAVRPDALVRLEVAVGTYVAEGGPLVTVWSGEDVGGDAPVEFVGPVRAAIKVGRERTMQEDVAFGLTMLEDIALRALSPGVNDPNTASAIIPQLGELILEILIRDLPPVRLTSGGVTIVRAAAPSYLDYLESAFGQIRRATETEPVVRLTMIRTLATIASELERREVAVPEAMVALRVSMTRLLPLEAEADDPAVATANELLTTTTWFASGS